MQSRIIDTSLQRSEDFRDAEQQICCLAKTRTLIICAPNLNIATCDCKLALSLYRNAHMGEAAIATSLQRNEHFGDAKPQNCSLAEATRECSVCQAANLPPRCNKLATLLQRDAHVGDPKPQNCALAKRSYWRRHLQTCHFTVEKRTL